MQLYSTNNPNHSVSLKEAVIKGLAPDQGLFMPAKIPQLSDKVINSLGEMPFREMSYEVAKSLLINEIPDNELRRIVEHAVAFDAPLVKIEEDVFSLELFHGPTMAFKDFGARFLSGLLGYFANEQNQDITILVATSGDTGSAVANGFLGVKGTRVIVLYPSGKVSDVQEKQFTTLGHNITALEVDGTFDDCQRLVKQAFSDEDLNRQMFLTSANSINIARLIPQSFYYFFAYAQLKNKSKPVVVSVPSGNFGNLTAGLMAKKMGLPISHFIAATNANDIVPKYLTTQLFRPQVSVATISNAMDVGNPSNFPRMQEIYSHQFELLKGDVSGYSFTDYETRSAMQAVYKTYGYVMDPHGAIGYLGLNQYKQQLNQPINGIFLETAHPGKFKETVDETLTINLNLPEKLKAFVSKQKISRKIGAEFSELKLLLPTIVTQ